MAFRFVLLLASVMAVSAGLLPSAVLQPTLVKSLQPVEVEAPAKYSFSYQVNDPTTGDIKSQEEVRDGDVVKGAYTLIDADGLQRLVQYTSDGINGFNAVVSRTPIGKQIAVAPAVPVIKTIQPTIVKTLAPSLIASPLAKIGPISPLLKPAAISPLGLPLLG